MLLAEIGSLEFVGILLAAAVFTANIVVIAVVVVRWCNPAEVDPEDEPNEF